MRGRFTKLGARLAESPAPLRYSLGVLSVLVALAFRMALNPVLGPNAPYLPFALAIILAGRLGGRGPALAATALSALGVLYFLIEPRYALMADNPHAVAGLALFAFVGVLISLLVGQLTEAHAASVRAEEALRRQMEMVDLSHDAIITANPKRVITGWNAGAAEMYGWAASEAVGRVIHELLQTGGRTPVAEIDRILSLEGRWDGELLHTSRDGRRIVTESRHVLVRDRLGNTVGFLEVNRDITERKLAEEAAREASEQRGLAMEASGLGAWDYRLATGAVFWDKRCRDVFGVPGEGPVDFKEAMGPIHAEDRPGSRKPFGRRSRARTAARIIRNSG